MNTVGVADATLLFELCPTALLFGMRDSTGPKGGLGAKFERAMVSEMVGVGVEVGDLRRGVRRDPLGTSKNVTVIPCEDRTGFRIAGGKNPGVRPSELGLASVPFPKQTDQKTRENYYDGVTIEYAEQTTTLSLICLRRLRFPLNGEPPQDEGDVAARTVLAALGLCAATLAFEARTDLRSRWLLWPGGPMVWELLDRPGAEPRGFPSASGRLSACSAPPWPRRSNGRYRGRRRRWSSSPRGSSSSWSG